MGISALLRVQAPDLADLELRDVSGGWDNQLWRLGEDLAVRLPRTERAPALLDTEQTWLPMLAERLPLPTIRLDGLVEVSKDGRDWQIGTASDVDWIAGRTLGYSIATAIPLVFDAYASFYQASDITAASHEQAVVADLIQHTADQSWWLGYLDTGAHDIVFPNAPKVSMYWGWPYVLVKAGPEQALTWRTGHLRDGLTGSLPDLFFPADRSWLVSALWDDTWSCIGGTGALIDALEHNPLANARRVQPDQDALPPGLARE